MNFILIKEASVASSLSFGKGWGEATNASFITIKTYTPNLNAKHFGVDRKPD